MSSGIFSTFKTYKIRQWWYFDDVSTLFDTIVPLGDLLDVHIAKAKETETAEIYETHATIHAAIRSNILSLCASPHVLAEFTKELMAYDCS